MMDKRKWNDSEYNNNNLSSGMSHNNGPPIPYSVFLNEYRTSPRKRPRRWDNPPSMSRRDAIKTAPHSIDGESANGQEGYAPTAADRWGFKSGRSPSTCQSTGHPTFERFNRNDWRCSACYLWNSLDRSRCLRCNSNQGSLIDRARSESRFIDINEATRKRPLPKTREWTPEWPPEFSTNGSDYVFDSRSSMFYASQSNFFYDPKSTLYYGNNQGAYYRYNGTKSPPFEKVERMVSFADQARTPKDISPDQDAEPANKTSIEEPHQSKGKKKLTIKINTVAIATPVVKKQAVDIERWTKKRGSENQKNANSTPVTAAPNPAKSKGSTTRPATKSKLSKDAGGIVRSSAGEPICAICMRKFSSAEKLKLHETGSALHKENLAKLRELEKSRSAIPGRQAPSPMKIEAPVPMQYVDRAMKRRNLYGESIMAPPIRPLTVAPVVHAVVDIEKNLGQESVGNKLFQKMLLKSQDAGGDQSPSAAAAPTGGMLVSDLTDNLRQDWARIESLAHGAMQRQRTGSNYLGGKGLGNNALR